MHSVFIFVIWYIGMLHMSLWIWGWRGATRAPLWSPLPLLMYRQVAPYQCHLSSLQTQHHQNRQLWRWGSLDGFISLSHTHSWCVIFVYYNMCMYLFLACCIEACLATQSASPCEVLLRWDVSFWCRLGWRRHIFECVFVHKEALISFWENGVAVNSLLIKGKNKSNNLFEFHGKNYLL